MNINELLTLIFTWRFKLKHIQVNFWQEIGTGFWLIKSAWIPAESKKVNYKNSRYNIEPECYLFKNRKWGFHMYPEINFKVGESDPLTWRKGIIIPAEIYGAGIRNDIFRNFLKAQTTKSYMVVIIILAIALCVSLVLNMYFIQIGPQYIPPSP